MIRSLCLALLPALLVGCAQSPTRASRNAGEKPSEWAEAIAGLCEARTHASTGRVEAARETFFGRSHSPLHDIARELQESDRAGAAKLLEAKQRVEQTLQTQDAQRLAGDFDALARAAAEASGKLGSATPGCVYDGSGQ